MEVDVDSVEAAAYSSTPGFAAAQQPMPVQTKLFFDFLVKNPSDIMTIQHNNMQ